MRDARLRLAALWLSQTARVLADNCLRMFVILQVARAGAHEAQAAWYQVTPFFILPFLLLAPITGPLGNGLPKRWVLLGASGFCLIVTGFLGLTLGTEGDAWLWCVGLLATMAGGALYSATRYALLPAVAVDAHLPLSTVNGWIEMGGAAGVVGGLLLGVEASKAPWRPWGFPCAIAVVLGLDLLSMLAAWPARFPSDICRPEPWGLAIAGFFRDARRVFHDAEARASLWGLAGFVALVVAGAGALLGVSGAVTPEGDREALARSLLLLGVGTAVGSLAAGWQGNPRRSLGLIPFGATGMVLALAWSGLTHHLVGPSLMLGFMAGLTNVPLRASYQRSIPADARGNGLAISNAVNYLLIVGAMVLLFLLSRHEWLNPAGQVWLLTAVAIAGCGAAWAFLFRITVDQCLEMIFWPMYRVRGRGPGAQEVPMRGPLLVIANHAAWFDPLYMGKVMPRRLIPMMTSDYYDRPGVHFWFAYIFQAIRVQSSRYRREAPEIAEAIAVLDRGGCVSLFPEGWLRRDPAPSVRKFGHGVWLILRERPGTPVVVCWIEGNYGSYTSYYNGKPTQNKKLDWWRPIDVAIRPPEVLPADVLADAKRTRTYLMEACLRARGDLGLEVPRLDAGKQKEDG